MRVLNLNCAHRPAARQQQQQGKQQARRGKVADLLVLLFRAGHIALALRRPVALRAASVVAVPRAVGRGVLRSRPDPGGRLGFVVEVRVSSDRLRPVCANLTD